MHFRRKIRKPPKKLMRRPKKYIYPYLCPYCGEAAYPVFTDEEKPYLRLPTRSFSTWRCFGGHEFLVLEKVIGDQEWGKKQYHREQLRQESKEWINELRTHNFDVGEVTDESEEL